MRHVYILNKLGLKDFRKQKAVLFEDTQRELTEGVPRSIFGSVEASNAFLVLVLLLCDKLLSLEKSLSALVDLETGHETVGWVNGDLGLRA
jgi:hypothetical protein